ncbi:hypothetical protein GCM10010106_31360 [Thermopolyspora flexuosa]|uniref:hypothetical protein n=1 Tax=Thermopolyspora flexuosa TaxID=103836 RepID=UPI0019B3FB0C|nr:hypothetical protein [Thermopolyspora flexuosa]GGM82465.1 hypothetical protein GCM10010106_31360 [Thermopolyspora flexuosa]
MKLHTDIPTRSDIDALMRTRLPWCVSLYLPTSPESLGEAERIGLGNLTREAFERMRALGADKDEIAGVESRSPRSRTTTCSGATRPGRSRCSPRCRRWSRSGCPTGWYGRRSWPTGSTSSRCCAR